MQKLTKDMGKEPQALAPLGSTELQLTVTANKRFVRKLSILELTDEMEIIEPMTLVNHLDMTYGAAKLAIWRLQKAGYLEPLTTKGGRWVLTNKGYDYLEFLRRNRDDKR